MAVLSLAEKGNGLVLGFVWSLCCVVVSLIYRRNIRWLLYFQIFSQYLQNNWGIPFLGKRAPSHFSTNNEPKMGLSRNGHLERANPRRDCMLVGKKVD